MPDDAPGPIDLTQTLLYRCEHGVAPFPCTCGRSAPASDAPAARRDTNQALFARILDLRHWTSNSAGADKRHDCKCEDCKAIKQIVHLARQAVATSQSKRAKQLEELTARAVRAEGERDAWMRVAAAWLIQAYGSGHGVAADLVDWAEKTLAGEHPWHVERTRAAIAGKEFR